MKYKLPLLLSMATTLLGFVARAQTIRSPSRQLRLAFQLSSTGEPTYELKHGVRTVVRPSRLAVLLQGAPGFDKGFTIIKVDSSRYDDTWTPVWGEVKQIRNHYQELTVTLQQAATQNRQLVLRFRLFDDGLGFRYEFPEQASLQYFTVSDEKTEFNLPADHRAFWMRGDYDTNEYRYSTTKLSEVSAATAQPTPEIATQTPIGPNAVQTPRMLKSTDGLYISIHEAALIDYPAMALLVNGATHGLTSQLCPDATGAKAYLQAPAHTPWRTLVVADNAPAILASKLILNLNEPSKLADTGWIKPQKYVGVWWEMQIKKGTWSYADATNLKLANTDFSKLTPHGRHAANTANVKRYIDFAGKNGLQGVLVEGWNVGWEDWFGNWKEEVFDFVTPYPDFDVRELQAYAASKNVKLIMHHENSGSVTNYERRMEPAYRFMREHGYEAVKTGYVGRIIPRGEHHDGQWMVNHYLRVAQKTAENHLMVDMHEPVRPTGLHRTYPNWLANEAARGNEFNAWSAGNPPEHETILPFTRLMGGPMDYTPGIFQIKLDQYSPQNQGKQVHTTLAKQLALYITLYSPLQMAADLPENYVKFDDAFQFIRDVAVDWNDTRILAAEPGDHITTVRQAKGKDEWYLGSITDENARQQFVKLDFLTPGRRYTATIYADDKDADWAKNPMAYRISRQVVTSRSALTLRLAPGGGAAVSFKPLP